MFPLPYRRCNVFSYFFLVSFCIWFGAVAGFALLWLSAVQEPGVGAGLLFTAATGGQILALDRYLPHHR